MPCQRRYEITAVNTDIQTDETIQAQKDEHKKQLEAFRDQEEQARRKLNDILDALRRDQQRQNESSQAMRTLEDEISRKKQVFSKFDTIDRTSKEKSDLLARKKEGFEPQHLQVFLR